MPKREPKIPLHPQPQLTREAWRSLDGAWEFAYDDEARWRSAQQAGIRRVERFYTQRDMLENYRRTYKEAMQRQGQGLVTRAVPPPRPATTAAAAAAIIAKAAARPAWCSSRRPCAGRVSLRLITPAVRSVR